jgi:hypothetical protein
MPLFPRIHYSFFLNLFTMKFSFLFFALFFTSVSAFATNASCSPEIDDVSVCEIEELANPLEDEICYTTTISVEIPVIGSGVGVEVSGCGATADEALGELMSGIVRLVKFATTHR